MSSVERRSSKSNSIIMTFNFYLLHIDKRETSHEFVLIVWNLINGNKVEIINLN